MLKSVRAQCMCGKSCVFQSKLSVIRAQCLIDGPCREEEVALLVTAQPHRMDSQRHVSLSSALFSGFHVFLCNTSLLHIQPDTTLVFTVFTVTRKWIILKMRHPISLYELMFKMPDTDMEDNL